MQYVRRKPNLYGGLLCIGTSIVYLGLFLYNGVVYRDNEYVIEECVYSVDASILAACVLHLMMAFISLLLSVVVYNNNILNIGCAQYYIPVSFVLGLTISTIIICLEFFENSPQCHSYYKKMEKCVWNAYLANVIYTLVITFIVIMMIVVHIINELLEDIFNT